MHGHAHGQRRRTHLEVALDGGGDKPLNETRLCRHKILARVEVLEVAPNFPVTAPPPRTRTRSGEAMDVG
jgi:hypothetical protein